MWANEEMIEFIEWLKDYNGEQSKNKQVIKLLTEISFKKSNDSDSEENSLNIEVNSLITANAENYYRTMVVNDNES